MVQTIKNQIYELELTINQTILDIHEYKEKIEKLQKSLNGAISMKNQTLKKLESLKNEL